MGLKTTNYKLNSFGITLPEAYARLTNVTIDVQGKVFGIFEIHQTRQDLENSKSLEKKHINLIIDKDMPIHRQIYLKAKEQLFSNWEDDIINESELYEDESNLEDDIINE